MASTWVVVAHQAGARIFEYRGVPKALTLVQAFENPEGKKRNREIDSDRPGAASPGSGYGVQRAMTHEQTAHERVVETFAKQIGETLSKARAHNMIDGLVLVAEPRFLGQLTGALDRATMRLVEAKVHKDLAMADEKELLEHVKKAFGVSAAPIIPIPRSAR